MTPNSFPTRTVRPVSTNVQEHDPGNCRHDAAAFRRAHSHDRYVLGYSRQRASRFRWRGEFEAWIVSSPSRRSSGSGCYVAPLSGAPTAFHDECADGGGIAWAALCAVLSLPSKSVVRLYCQDARAIDLLDNTARALFDAEDRPTTRIKNWNLWREIPEAIRRRQGLTIAAVHCAADDHSAVFDSIADRVRTKALAVPTLAPATTPKRQYHPSAPPRDYAPLGGKQHYEAALDWARRAYTADEARQFNALLADGGDAAGLAMKVLVARFEAAAPQSG